MSRLADPHDRLVAGMRAIGALSEGAEAELRQLPMRVQHIASRRDVFQEGDQPHECCLVVEGLFVSHAMINGGQRQILSFHLPGDLPDLQSLHIPETDFSLEALTPGCVAFISHAALHAALERAPGLRALLWRLTLADAALLRARLSSIGRRTAYGRVAHLFCEAFVRMRALGLAEEMAFTLPMTQTDLADALGLSAVHVNRTLQQLRRDGVIVSRGHRHSFTDWPRLRAAGGFDDGYLSQCRNAPLAPGDPSSMLHS